VSGCLDASTAEEIITETAITRITERGATRMDDQTSEAIDGAAQEGRILLTRRGNHLFTLNLEHGTLNRHTISRSKFKVQSSTTSNQ